MKKFLKNRFEKSKSVKGGIETIIIAILLVLVVVGAFGAVSGWFSDSVQTAKTNADTAITKVIDDSNSNSGS